MVKALKPFLKGTVCDPACGTAGFLTKVNDYADVKLFGFEVDERLAWVSTLNLYIHGANDFETCFMSNGGSLGSEADSYYESIDVILTNPPFGSDYTDRKILDKYVLGKDKNSRRRGILFIEQSWNLLKKDGILAIIIDQGVLNSKTNMDVREYIFSHFEIMGVIDLPESAFLPYANVSSLRQNPPFSDNQIDYAKNDERGLLTTWQLYNQYKLIENGIFTKKETRESLDKWGLISLLPKNLIRVGIYKEYFKKPKAGILTLNNVKLEVGKMIYAKKDGKWICTSIVSIQLNDKDVDQVDNGEVGIVTDIELEKGYEIFVKIE